MKIKTKVLCLLLISTSVFAASDLVKEFTRRRQIVISQQKKAVFAFLREKNKRPIDVRELELLNDHGKFALRFANDDVCFGDVETVSMQCYNAVGLRTYFEQGDND